jgi:hypothetical protein
MTSSYTVVRRLFTCSPLILAGLYSMTQAGCSGDVTQEGVGGGSSAVSTGALPATSGAGSGSTSGAGSGSTSGAGSGSTSGAGSGSTSGAGGGDGGGPSTEGFAESSSCSPCHTAIYEDWESSMHAHSVTSPVMVAQANQVFAADLLKNENEELQHFCVLCHSPISALSAKTSTLPFVTKDPKIPSEALREGVGCVTCHAYTGNPKDSKAVTWDITNDITPGNIYYGPFEDPAPNGGFHFSSTTPLYLNNPDTLCLSCHNVKNDRDGDKKFELGVDLFLQTTFDEYDIDYGIQGENTCLDCHMPERKDVHQAADGFPGAPIRTVHDHKFAGVDYPLDLFASGEDPQKNARRELLQGGGDIDPAASLTLNDISFDGTNLAFNVTIGNENGGHSLPTGFAFMRQMWVEIIVEDSDKFKLAQSGELQNPINDLCDNDTLKDNLAPIVQGCQNNVPDPQLVNFQTLLVDFVALDNGVLVKDPVKGHETHLQFQTGGAVARSRPKDVAAGLGMLTLAPIKAFESRTFAYNFTVAPQDEDIRIKATLKFRNLPPYFVRRLAQAEGPKDVLGNLLSFEITDMVANFQQIPVGTVVQTPQKQ